MTRSLPLKILPCIVVLCSCGQLEEHAPGQVDSVMTQPVPDTLSLKEKFFRNMDSMKVDTSKIEGKIKHTTFLVMRSIYPNAIQSDTMIDLNYDGKKDLVFSYYGAAGTGEKNAIVVYCYDQKADRFVFNRQLSALANPSFYLEKKKITGFYIGHGGGDGIELQWNGNRWDTTRTFTVSNKGDSSIWIVETPKPKERELIRRPFSMYPPGEILETKF